MSALTDLFSAMANKIRSKTGTQTLYTPAQMVSDGIDDVYAAGYDAGGGGGGSGMPITPSNATPVSLESGEVYQPTANGYAIESYSSVTPSDSSPVSLTSGSIYKAAAAGKAVASVSDITPSSTTATPLSINSIYKMTLAGYAIKSYDPITPSSSGSYFYSGFNKMSSSGYAYSSQQAQTKTGTVTLSTSTTTSVTCGFKPKYVALVLYKDSTHAFYTIYNEDISTSYQFNAGKNGSTMTSAINNVPNTTATSANLYSIDSNGFTVCKISSNNSTSFGLTCKYFAIG